MSTHGVRKDPKGKCWTSRGQLIDAVGVVNAEIKALGKTGVRYSTKYREVAFRIESMGKSINARVLATVTDEGVYVVSLRGLYQSKGAV